MMIANPKFLAKPPECPDEIYSLMAMCWRSEPTERPTFATLFKKLDDYEKSLKDTQAEPKLNYETQKTPSIHSFYFN